MKHIKLLLNRNRCFKEWLWNEVFTNKSSPELVILIKVRVIKSSWELFIFLPRKDLQLERTLKIWLIISWTWVMWIFRGTYTKAVDMQHTFLRPQQMNILLVSAITARCFFVTFCHKTDFSMLADETTDISDRAELVTFVGTLTLTPMMLRRNF